MSTIAHVLDSRYDYLKFQVPIFQKVNIERWERLYNNWLTYCQNAGISPETCSKTTVTYGHPDKSLICTRYLEIWGVHCDFVFTDLAEGFTINLTRADVCIESDNVSVEMLRELSARLLNTDGLKRNVSAFNSRDRSKEGGRSPGGFGVAIGSHKSDVRVTAYVRLREQGKWEIQCTGKVLQRLINIAHDKWRHGKEYDQPEDQPALLKDELLYELDRRLEQIGVDTSAL